MRRNLTRLAARLYNTALLIEPSKAEVIERVFAAHLFGEVDETLADKSVVRWSAPRPGMAAGDAEKSGVSVLSNGVALIPVMGTLVQRGSWMDALSGLTAYDTIAAQLQAALGDSNVRAIVLEFDSPGGEASGLFTLADKIVAARDVKPVYGMANEVAFSAAYALAASVDKLYAPRTGMVGSIGAVIMHADQSQRDAKNGITYTMIGAGSKKAQFNEHQPLSASALRDAQAIVDDLRGVFAQHVANARGADLQAILDTEAGLISAPEALELGLITGLATLDEVVHLAAQAAASRASMALGGVRTAASPVPSLETDMSKEAEKSDAAGQAATVQTQAHVAAQPTLDAGKIAADATAAERARVAAIMGCEEAKTRPALAQKMVAEGVSAELAKSLMASAAKEGAGNALASAMDRVPNPDVSADAGAQHEQQKGQRPTAANVYEMRRKQARAASAGR